MTNTLNDMSVDELEALAARVSATVKQKREEDEEKNVVRCYVAGRDYAFNKNTKVLTYATGSLGSRPSNYQSVIDEVYRSASIPAKTEGFSDLSTIFAAIAKAL